MKTLKALWLSVRSNKIFVAFEGAVIGSIGDSLYDAVQKGHLDFSAEGLKRLAATALIAGVTAVRMLKRPAPADQPATNSAPRLALAFVAALALMNLFGSVAAAQNVNNLYVAGISVNPSAVPKVAGTALYAHQVNDGGTYAFTVFDALPVDGKAGTVTTNVGIGVAQKLVTVAGHDVYVPTSAGVQWTGQNMGWQWSTGAGATFKLRAASDGAWYLMPTIRVLKGSVSGPDASYQLVPGLMVGWGK
jgi:hypothetical protein